MSVFLKVQRFLFHSLSTLFIIFILSGCNFSVPLNGAFRSSDLRISATVISGTGDEAKIGDFITETLTPVPSWGFVTVEVVGLESCNAPYAGGFCTSKE